MCHENHNWLEVLPTALLGLRTCFKEELKSSYDEMLYGSNLRILGEFFLEEDPLADLEIFLEKHRIAMRNITSRPTSHHCYKTPFFHKNFFDCTHVWVRDDSVRKELQPPYFGPFRIINRINDYLFTIDFAGKSVNVSTERLKPAFLPKEPDSTSIIPTLPSTTSTSSLPTSSSTPQTSKKSLRIYPGSKKKVQFAT